tara:strand:+ start:1764 stop:2495 length:732 start_codon:yes stop_codon:yes gene_type:complete
MFSLSLTLGIVSTLLKISVFCSVFFIVASFFCLVLQNSLSAPEVLDQQAINENTRQISNGVMQSDRQRLDEDDVFEGLNTREAYEQLGIWLRTSSNRSSLSSLSLLSQDVMSDTTRQQHIDEFDISCYLPRLNEAITLSYSILRILSILNEPAFHGISEAAKKNIVNSAKDPSTGQTVLMVAIQAENHDCVDRLIALGADVNAQDNSNKTVLDYATEVYNEPIITSLLFSGANATSEGFGSWV